MPSASRYFATVRRLISTPSPLSASVMAASDSGRRASSAATSALMRSLMASDDRAALVPPAPVAGRAVEKKCYKG